MTILTIARYVVSRVWFSLRPLGYIMRYGGMNERNEGILVDLFTLAYIERAARITFQAGIEDAGRIVQRCAIGKGQLDNLLVSFAGADDAVMRPNRNAAPFPFLDHVRIGLLMSARILASVAPRQSPSSAIRPSISFEASLSSAMKYLLPERVSVCAQSYIFRLAANLPA